MMLEILSVILWGFIGTFNLCVYNRISRLDYAFCWSVLMVHLIGNAIVG